MTLPSAQVTEPRLTLEEWFELDEDDWREWVDGELVEAEVPNLQHELIVSWFVRKWGYWAEERGAIVVASGLKIAVSPRRGRLPDAAMYLAATQRPKLRELVRVPPDHAMEVVSATPRDGRRDRVEKLHEYAAFGIRWYWIVDPSIRTVEIFELDRGRYALAVSAAGGTISVPGCEGLTLDLDALWRQVDEVEGA